jgi:hypothetical protein
MGAESRPATDSIGHLLRHQISALLSWTKNKPIGHGAGNSSGPHHRGKFRASFLDDEVAIRSPLINKSGGALFEIAVDVLLTLRSLFSDKQAVRQHDMPPIQHFRLVPYNDKHGLIGQGTFTALWHSWS